MYLCGILHWDVAGDIPPDHFFTSFSRLLDRDSYLKEMVQFEIKNPNMRIIFTSLTIMQLESFIIHFDLI